MSSYELKKRHYLGSMSGVPKKSVLLFALFIIFAVFVIAYSVTITIRMQRTSAKNAEDYVGELTSQIAGTLSSEQDDKKTALKGIVSTVELTATDGVKETGSYKYLHTYLNAALKASDFEYLIFLRANGSDLHIGKVPEDIAVVMTDNYEAVIEARAKNDCIAYVEKDYVLYLSPVYKDDQYLGTLAGGVKSDMLYELINVQTYRDENNFCITNRDGKLLVASGDGSFAELKSMLESGSVSMNELAERLGADIESGSSGTFELSFTDGKEYMVAYSPIEGEDWMLFTIIPSDLFSGVYKRYMIKGLLCCIGAAIVFVGLAVLLGIVYRRARNKLSGIAFTDVITDGINDVEFRFLYDDVIRTKKDPLEYSILMMDIKDFKLINEYGGFYMGNDVLKLAYDSMHAEMNKEYREFAARAEMDHFFLCIHEHTEDGILKRIAGIEKRVNEAESEIPKEFNIEFECGAYIIDDTFLDAASLQDKARIAKRYVGRGPKKKCVIFTDDMQKNIFRERLLDHMAEESVKNHDFLVYYQPKVSMSTGLVKGAEALVRWNHPERGLISPAEFIPVLENSGRIQDVDKYVFEEVCRWVSEREATGEEMFPVSVNLSRLHFWRENFIDDFVRIADKYHVNRDYIEFEVTETILMEEEKHSRIRSGISKMHEHGFRCSMDDFGVGYSSLSLVCDMNVDILKFDRSFFLDLKEEKKQKVVRCLFNMAHELELGMVIEGIETQEQIDFLKNEKCDVIQGYYYSRPLPEDDFEKWLEDRKSAVSEG